MPDMSWAIAYSYILIATFTARSSAQGLITDVEGPDGGGGSGSSSGSGVSSAGMIALCTVAGVVVFIGSLFSKATIPLQIKR
jgi:hypothetical protein